MIFSLLSYSILRLILLAVTVPKLLIWPWIKKLSLIKLVVTDVDGVLTDGNLYIDSKGNETN